MYMKFIFFGTPELSVIVLDELKAAGLLPVAIVTQADKPQGRGQKLHPSPVKVWGEKEKIPVLSPLKATDPEFLEQLKTYNADTFVVAAYGKILRPQLLEIPRLPTINLHPSLLPEYRGPAPIQGPLRDGKTETGVTIMLIDEEMDHGDVLAQEVIPIAPEDDAHSLTTKLAHEGGKLLAETLVNYVAGNVTPTPQDHDKATYIALLQKSDGEIHWDKSATDIVNQIRAYTLWPTSWSMFTSDHYKKPVRVKILAAHKTNETPTVPPGTLHIKNELLGVATQDGMIIIDQLQFEGKPPITGAVIVRTTPQHVQNGQFLSPTK